ncbi:glycosyltransferase [Corynebacterium terpenotabidum]|uniref:Putative glycosyltransferase n=1 Tax=Corynebacterium terpenotabidum Y-11 TaxID=1200352 RepID=S4XE87_9CORY|nr:glycosyltransferase [Corynebacterium terpenotabidum]AGP29915.1 putative glycosyltransferase [Corynebacterium terpenotabidum Y-11]
MRILHVTDCYHGGVATAVDQYARLTPEQEHLLLSNNARGADAPVPRTPGVFAVDEELPASPVDAVRAVRAAVRRYRPDLVHAHSSFAGAYARVAAVLDRVTPGRAAVPVVYTPHSFAFERADIPAWKQAVFRGMEKALFPFTSVGAPCADREGELMADLSRGVPGTVPVIVVPNVLLDDHPATPGSWAPTDPPTVGVVSRVTPQRDPAFFIETARLIREQRPDTRFVWIGDGDGKDATLTDLLADADIDVTGWLSGDELRDRIAGLSLVIHTARWDGFPMAVLEVRRIGVPLLVRDIPALRECPASARFSTPEDAAAKAVRILDEHADPAPWDGLDQAHAPERQRARLSEAYALAVR